MTIEQLRANPLVLTPELAAKLGTVTRLAREVALANSPLEDVLLDPEVSDFNLRVAALKMIER